MTQTIQRCPWPGNDQLMIHYHDTEWGVPVHDDRKLFEFMVLDAAQAGLTWKAILHRRESYRKAFDNFDAQCIAKYSKKKILSLLNDTGIIRNHLKIASAINNAAQFLKIQAEYGSFDTYIWQFVNGKPLIHSFTHIHDIPATSLESEAMSKDLRQRGFSFVGPTICYAFMQAAGLVNDHTTNCFRYQEILHI